MLRRTFFILSTIVINTPFLIADEEVPVDSRGVVSISEHESLATQIESLQQQIDWLRQQHNPDVLGTLRQQQIRERFGRGGVYFSSEVSFLRPWLSGARSSATATGGRWLDPSYAPATRFTLGCRTDTGLGFRTSYFSLHEQAPLASNFGGGALSINVEAVDTEVTLRQRLTNWDVEVSGGVRYGKLAYGGDGVVIFPGELSFEGVGPTVAVNGRRRLGDSRFVLFGSLRGSLLLGDIYNVHPARGLAAGPVQDELTQVIDNQLGVAWETNIRNGAVLEVRTAWETQFWLNDTLADDVYGVGTNLGLSGPTVAVELRY